VHNGVNTTDENAVEQHCVADITNDQLSTVGYIFLLACGEIVQRYHLMPVFEQQFRDMSTDETRAACYQNTFSHVHLSLSLLAGQSHIRLFRWRCAMSHW